MHPHCMSAKVRKRAQKTVQERISRFFFDQGSLPIAGRPALGVTLDKIMISRTALFFCLLATVFAGDWPQWRGPHRDGVGNTISEPKVWPEQLRLKWKVKVGEGHSTPLAAGG